MIINKGKHFKENRISNKSTMPPIFTIGILFVLISFILVAKGLLQDSYNEVAVMALSNYVITTNSQLNNSEQAVLTSLTEVMKPSGQKRGKETQGSIYYNILEEFFNRSNVDLTADQAAGVSDKILDIKEILSNEGKTDYTQLSLDGKKVVFYLLDQIYELCGLQLEGNTEGNIVKIYDLSGNVLYNNIIVERKLNFQLNAFAVVMVVIVVLFIICFSISKKNQLFNKEVIYDGFDEEKFA